jgi:hypothetical protein
VANRILGVAIITLSSVAAFAGGNLLFAEIRQSQAQAMLEFEESNANSLPRNLQLKIKEQVYDVARFGSPPGSIGSMHKTIATLLEVTRSDSAEVERNLRGLLRVEPASGSNWLALAKIRMKQDRSGKSAFSALKMSELTEPREIDVIVQRTRFYLSLWETMPDGKKIQALRELSDTVPFMGNQAIQEIKSEITARTMMQRQAIKEQLLAWAAGEKAWMKAIGL